MASSTSMAGFGEDSQSHEYACGAWVPTNQISSQPSSDSKQLVFLVPLAGTQGLEVSSSGEPGQAEALWCYLVDIKYFVTNSEF